MFKKIIQIIGILILTTFSFFYTEKVNEIVKQKDPIMIKINETKDDSYVSLVKPIVDNDEYVYGLNGCEVDIDKSYSKMKTIGEYKDELIVMKEIENKNKINDKYIISANKIQKNISIIFLINDEINNDLIDLLKNKNISGNFFIDQTFLEDNIQIIRFLSESNNIYYLGNKGKYEERYMVYSNNLIEINSNNKSEYCLTNKKDENTLKTCADYNMKTIKVDIIKNNLAYYLKNNLSNGSILAFDIDDINQVKVGINYILSKGYNIVSLDKLLNENVKCK